MSLDVDLTADDATEGEVAWNMIISYVKACREDEAKAIYESRCASVRLRTDEKWRQLGHCDDPNDCSF